MSTAAEMFEQLLRANAAKPVEDRFSADTVIGVLLTVPLDGPSQRHSMLKVLGKLRQDVYEDALHVLA